MLKLKAMVIDDSKIMRQMVMKALRESRLAEWEFAEADDGSDALAKFDPNTVDICFVDWNMPTMTGVEFIKQARARGDTGLVPMVMVTSEKSMAKIEEALEQAGADAFVCKPFTADEMRGKLQRVVDRLEGLLAEAAGGAVTSKLFG